LTREAHIKQAAQMQKRQRWHTYLSHELHRPIDGKAFDECSTE